MVMMYNDNDDEGHEDDDNDDEDDDNNDMCLSIMFNLSSSMFLLIASRVFGLRRISDWMVLFVHPISMIQHKESSL